MLQTRYYNIGEREQGKCLVQTRSQNKTSGIILPEVHGIHKGIDPNIRLEKQVIKPVISPEVKGISHVKPRLAQGRPGNKKHLNFLCSNCMLNLNNQNYFQVESQSYK